ncbi:3-phosphoserine/phosphohydroxythreonine transaminase [Wenyingzhuangia sp. chi5]|uniref:Phosphoserine aminotransferase n=1 Tax=Wenyingzhuangia gilva TaxID=3057677 RepID=A0ABT8VSD5_9FLAO|nr:3-phosphoserine/phosphohydroxythreonine transaminase [Wenyingzhuangia sp. chi5]MDO3694873.1 3-phosphoserine/phosphohydroxythreonine transaminase [Wenyingzhuangia sp. chi5]
MKKHNFSAGPSILPQEVFEKASQAVLDFDNTGLSLIEISHRSKEFVAVYDKAVALVKELLNVPETHEVLFLQGGASMQFLMTAINLMKNEGGKAAYVDTGAWSSKAIKEAKLFGQVDVVASSEDTNYNYIPKGYSIPTDADYVHITSNNTIFGTQFKEFPTTEVPLVADMSSDIFSKPVDVSKFGIIYAGAQKNLGPAGATLVIVKKDLLGNTGRTIPSMLDYQIHIKGESMFNTPPVFAIYVSMLNLEYMKAQGGLKAVEKHNEEKAAMLYNEIDNNPSFVNSVAKEDRSLMNVVFLLKDESKDAEFLAACAEAGISNVKGHRSVGGFRASIYNAMPKESVQALIDVMKKF